MKQFAYVDDYNPNEAPNRRIKRIIEDENKKLRTKERRAFNDSMRELVAHLKFNDKRKHEFDRIAMVQKEQYRKEKEAKLEEARKKQK